MLGSGAASTFNNNRLDSAFAGLSQTGSIGLIADDDRDLR